MSNIRTDKVVRVPERMNSYSYSPQSSQPLAEIRFNKSPSTLTIQRSYNTLDTYLSYVGGLIGTIIGLMFLLGKYNEKAFEISLAKQLFTYPHPGDNS